MNQQSIKINSKSIETNWKSKKVKIPSKLILCTDSQMLSDLAESVGVESYLTDKSCKSGSERIASVIQKLVNNAWDDFVLNNHLTNYDKLRQTLVIIY